MALPSDYISGTITLTNGSTAFTGTGTGWLAADFREGDIILDVEGGEGAVAVIASITSNTAGVLSKEWEGPTLTDVAYRMRYQWDSGRVSAQSRAAIEMLGNGNLQSFASLTGPGVPVFDGPHSVTIKPESDFVNGVAYDVQVDTLADRDAYDGQSEGFAVLVSDVGDGRSALYSKNSNAVGDWSDPAYITGPVGPLPDVEATVDMLPPGSSPTVTPTPITGGVRLGFELPEASGFYNAGVYDFGEAYDQDDVVRHNGSSFIALQSVPAGEEPSSASPPVDTAYWQVLAAKGQDGNITGVTPFWQSRILNDTDAAAARGGLGAVASPASATADTVALFDGGPELLKGVPWSTLALGLTQKVKLFTASGTYTPDPKLIFGEVTCVPGGSGAGGVTGLSSFIFMSGGGSTGGIARKFFTPAMVGASQPVTVGAKGIGGTGNNNGGAGGNSSFGTLCIALGPPGSPYSTAGSAGVGAPGGGLGTGDIRATGASGGGAEAGTVTTNTNYVSGKGADGPFGTGGRSRVGAANSSGEDASGYGAGGGGAVVVNSTATAKGGDGSPGLVFVIEWCWGN